MPIGIEDLLRARQVHNLSLDHILLVSLMPAVLGVIFSVLLSRGREASLVARMCFALLFISLNLFVGVLGLVIAGSLLPLFGFGFGNGWSLYLLSLAGVALVDFLFWALLKPEDDEG